MFHLSQSTLLCVDNIHRLAVTWPSRRSTAKRPPIDAVCSSGLAHPCSVATLLIASVHLLCHSATREVGKWSKKGLEALVDSLVNCLLLCRDHHRFWSGHMEPRRVFACVPVSQRVPKWSNTGFEAVLVCLVNCLFLCWNPHGMLSEHIPSLVGPLSIQSSLSNPALYNPAPSINRHNFQ